MINSVLTMLKLLLALLPFIALCLLSGKVNLRKSMRSKQYPIVPISWIYVLAAMLFANKIDEAILLFLDNLPKWMAMLSAQPYMPQTIGNWIQQAAGALRDFLQGLNLTYWIFFITNTAIILIYLILKRAALAIIKRTVKYNSASHARIAANFYRFDPDAGKWCLQNDFVHARTLLKVFYYTAVILSSILMAASRMLYTQNLLEGVFYPVFGVIVLGELYFYLDGLTIKELTTNIFGEADASFKTVNYSLLRKFLRSIFSDKLIAEGTAARNPLAYGVTNEEILHDLEKQEDQKICVFAEYLKQLNQRGVDLDHNYIQSALDLLCGKSILFNNPFYNDLIPYAFYPMNRTLLSHRKVLVVLGRHAIEADVTDWLERGIASVTNIPSMWSIRVLDKAETPVLPDIGIITRSDVLDIEVHHANDEFLSQVGFVVILEPSRLITTAQIGLNLLIKQCRSKDQDQVYCLCDQNCDGLVDAMSHILMTSITEVAATEKHRGTVSHMCWNADSEYLHHRLVPNISRYLGIGTELSFAALKNQVSKTQWYGGDAFPVVDMNWIDKQYYFDLMSYTGLPASQKEMDTHFVATSNFWSARAEKNSFITVEDESHNMFELLRSFSTRTKEQGFINVISSDYLLKDYMAENASIFETDAKAIPLIAADYARTSRNVILRLILMMSIFPVNEATLISELSLTGIATSDLRLQLWYMIYTCFSSLAELAGLPADPDAAMRVTERRKIQAGDKQVGIEILLPSCDFNMHSGRMENTWSIRNAAFIQHFVSDLRSAGYVAEDERGEHCYLGSELSGHIYQKYLPGQFFTFGGKYYEMQHLTADGRVLVRRAADHIDGRPSYRQIRTYRITGTKPVPQIGAKKNISGLKIIHQYADLCVSTSGYYAMESYNNFVTAKKVLFEGDGSRIPERFYRNKEVLRVELPDIGGRLTPSVCYTIVNLFNEVFRTIFAENAPYICAVMDTSCLPEDADVRPLTYDLTCDGASLPVGCFYIIEDSQLDLGLTIAVERNFTRIFGIVEDYLSWHNEMMEDSLNPPPPPPPPATFSPTPEKKPGFWTTLFTSRKKEATDASSEEKKKKNREEKEKKKEVRAKRKAEKAKKKAERKAEKEKKKAERVAKKGKKKPRVKDKKGGLLEILKRIFGKKNTPAPDAPEGTDLPEMTDLPTSADGESTQDHTGATENGSEDLPEDTADTPSSADGDDSSAQQASSVIEPPKDGENAYVVLEPRRNCAATDDAEDPFSFTRAPYHERCYLLYGQTSVPESLDINGTLAYLEQARFGQDSMEQARDGRAIAELMLETYDPNKEGCRFCDFCGTQIFGVEFETIADGRQRCVNCSRTAVKTEEEFIQLFADVKRNMEAFFGIQLSANVRVEMVNAKTLHSRLGKSFVPTSAGGGGRTLGVAIKSKNDYNLLIENGSPRMASMLTMAHELTHIWQYLNWNARAIRKKYGRALELQVYEGMAKWVEVQYAYLINEPIRAKREILETACRRDEYGFGFLRYSANYPFSTGTVLIHDTPFVHRETPLDLQYVGAIQPMPLLHPLHSLDDDAPETSSGSPLDAIRRFRKKRRDRLTIREKATVGSESNACKVTDGTDSMNIQAPPYAFPLLSPAEKELYEQLLDGIRNFRPEVTDLSVKLEKEAAERVLHFIVRDHPELFWFFGDATIYTDSGTGTVVRIVPVYSASESEAAATTAAIEAAVPAFLTGLSSDASDYDKALCVYENIIRLTTYDHAAKDTHKEPGEADDARSITGVFLRHSAVCAGYAKAVQFLLNRLGILCTCVTSQTHAWNLVRLDGNNYYLDATFGDITGQSSELPANSVLYDYFCMTDADVACLKEHTPDHVLPLPPCTSQSCNYYVRTGTYIADIAEANSLSAIITGQLVRTPHEIALRFATPELFATCRSRLLDGGMLFDCLRKVGRENATVTHTQNSALRTLTVFLSD